MKKIVFIFLCYLSIYSNAQTLYSDDKGILVFCKIERTEKFTLCKGNTNFSTKKVYVWKVTLEIENGYSQTIVPRGVGIANISVIPNPVKPYSHDYCNYKYVENYEPNLKQRHLDQSLYIWPIRNYKVKAIKAGESISNTTYLYLYEGQTPKLSNSQFLGYRLKKDFKSYDPILSDIANDPKPVVILDTKTKQKTKKLDVKYKNEISIDIKNEVIKPKPVTILEHKTNQEIKDIKNKIDTKEITDIKTVKVSVDTIKEVSSTNSIITKEITPINSVKKKTDSSIATKCPGEKASEYREKSNTSSDQSEQKAYSWLALYYTYKCECEMGSPRSDQLVPMINNLVDSYTTNTNDAFGKISKVTKCKMPIKD